MTQAGEQNLAHRARHRDAEALLLSPEMACRSSPRALLPGILSCLCGRAGGAELPHTPCPATAGPPHGAGGG